MDAADDHRDTSGPRQTDTDIQAHAHATTHSHRYHWTDRRAGPVMRPTENHGHNATGQNAADKNNPGQNVIVLFA